MTKEREKSEKDIRMENAVAGDGAPMRELELDLKDQNPEVAGEPKEQKESTADKKLHIKEETEAEKAEEARKAAAKNATSTTSAVNAGTRK